MIENSPIKINLDPDLNTCRKLNSIKFFDLFLMILAPQVIRAQPTKIKNRQKKSKVFIIPAKGIKKQRSEISPVMFNFLKSKTIKIIYRLVIVMTRNMKSKTIEKLEKLFWKKN